MAQSDNERLWKTIDRIDEIVSELTQCPVPTTTQEKLKSIQVLIADIRSIDRRGQEYCDPFQEGYF